MCIRDSAPDGCIVKTAGVPEHQWSFRGPAKVAESQEEAVEMILAGRVVAGDVVVVRYEGPKGGPCLLYTSRCV